MENEGPGHGDAAGDRSLATRIEAVYRADSRRVLATLIRLLGDFDRAEEAMQEAFGIAAERWPHDGVPANPYSWLISAGRFRAIDHLRRRARFDASLKELAVRIETQAPPPDDEDRPAIEDDRLRLVFTCCHPALPSDAKVALTLREVCGLTTEEIAAAFLAPPATVAQRIVRAKTRIRDQRIPYEVPPPAEMPARLEDVLRVVYLVFNEGYSASQGSSATRPDLSAEAIRLCRLIAGLLPDAEVSGLLALMLLHEARRPARADAGGAMILLEDQDRDLWDPAMIAEGRERVAAAFATGEVGSYAIQAAISAEHAGAVSTAQTDWTRVVSLYDLLMKAEPSPVVELNRAVAVAMRDGEAAGIALIDAILSRGDLAGYHPAHVARAELCRRAGRLDEARTGFAKALTLMRQDAARAHVEKRLRELGKGS